MSTRRFAFTITGVLELDEEVISAVDDEWRKRFYALEAPNDIAAHLAFNLVVNNADLTQLDGFADKDAMMALIRHESIEVDAVEIEE